MCRFAVSVAAAALALTGAACATPPGAQTAPADATPGAGSEAQVGAAAVCGEVEQTVDQGHHHLVGDAESPVDYATQPPTSGWHHRERDRIRTGVASPDDPLTEPEQVSVLAVGGVVVSYHALAEDERGALADLVREHDDRVALTAYPELQPGQVALTAWRLRQLCSGVDPVAVSEFIHEHAAPELDYGMSGEPDDHDRHDDQADER